MRAETDSGRTIVQTKADVIALIRSLRAELQAFGVKRLGMFGSFVREEQEAESDIDFLVEFEPGKKTVDNLMGLAFLLEDLSGRRVELLTPESLSPYIGPYILREIEYVSFDN